MRDLISEVNNLDANSAHILQLSFGSMADFIINKDDRIKFFYIMNETLLQINSKYKTHSIELKQWILFIIRKLYLKDRLKYVEDISENIDTFVQYYKSKENEYENNALAHQDIYDKYLPLVESYLNQ